MLTRSIRIARIVLIGLIPLMFATPQIVVADERPESGAGDLTDGGTGDVGINAFVTPPTGYVAAYFFTGARTNASIIATSVHCSNLLGATTGIIVEFYNYSGIRVGFRSYNLVQYQTQTVSASSTGLTALYVEDFPATLSVDLDQGIVRVLKKGTGRIVCSAQVLDAVNLPPAFVLPLTHFGPTGLH